MCGQVEVWPSGLSSIAPEALLVARSEVKGLNSIILNKVKEWEFEGLWVVLKYQAWPLRVSQTP